MKYLVALLFSLLSLTASGAQLAPMPKEDCVAQAPYGFPKDSVANTTTVCRKAYVLQHDNVAKIPVWVSYVLTPEHTTGCLPRSNKFATDGSIPVGKRAEKSDYSNSGYDKGHIANSADMTWNKVAAEESFILSNMAPQTHSFNAGIWKVLETEIRGWAYSRNHPMLVIAGPIYDLKTAKTIGRNKVVVPPGFYKIVVDTKTNETLAFMFPHSDTNSTDLRPFLTTVDEIEAKTGIDFQVPNESKVGVLWKDGSRQFENAKKATCSLH